MPANGRWDLIQRFNDLKELYMRMVKKLTAIQVV
jgi:hypothetical protein